MIDRLIQEIKKKKNPCIVGLDPEWDKLPECYKQLGLSKPEAVLCWAKDVIDAVADIMPAVKPQMAFYEVYGAEGVRTFEKIVAYAHEKGLLVIDDSKRNDIGNTARAYAYAHLAKEGPINADFLTVSPFLGRDSIQPFIDVAIQYNKGIFVLVKTSNPGSVEISEARNVQGEKISYWLAEHIASVSGTTISQTSVSQPATVRLTNSQASASDFADSQSLLGECGYSPIGAVVGATFPEEAAQLRKIMKHNFFLVPGFGAQGGSVEDIIPCFNEDGLGAVVSSSRGIIYKYQEVEEYDNTREQYREIVRKQAIDMGQQVYAALKENCERMKY